MNDKTKFLLFIVAILLILNFIFYLYKENINKNILYNQYYGQDGKDGAPGKNGKAGEPGKPGLIKGGKGGKGGDGGIGNNNK